MKFLFVVVSFALLPGCGESNTVCTIGMLLCTDSSGEVTQNGNAQLRKCAGPAEGGDEDGEFVVVEDCAARDLACYLESELIAGVERGGCIARACAEDSIVDCLQLGWGICELGGSDLMVCGTGTDGCQHYVTDSACTASGGHCAVEPTTHEAFCQP